MRAGKRRRCAEDGAVPLDASTISAVKRIASELARLNIAQLAGCSEQLATLLDDQEKLRRQPLAVSLVPGPSTDAWYMRPALCPTCQQTFSNDASLKRHAKSNACNTRKSLCQTERKNKEDKKNKKEKKKKKKKTKMYKLDRISARSTAACSLVASARRAAGYGLPLRIKGEVLVDVVSGNKVFHVEPGLEAMVLNWDDHVCLYTPSVGFAIIRLRSQPVKVDNTEDAIARVWNARRSLAEMNTLDLKGRPIPNDKNSMQAFYRTVVGPACSKPATLLHYAVVSSFLKPKSQSAE
jgi:hypothetical protein